VTRGNRCLWQRRAMPPYRGTNISPISFQPRTGFYPLGRMAYLVLVAKSWDLRMDGPFIPYKTIGSFAVQLRNKLKRGRAEL
jgi:hypothetical protein